MKIEQMTTSIHGQSMDELFKCENCVLTHPNGTAAVQARTLINIRKYMVVQLKTFDYNRTTQRPYKVIPKLQIEEQVNTILLGKLNLCAVIYHIGDSPIQGHYVASVKDGNRWYTCDDATIRLGVKLNCDPSNEHDHMIPYLVIYEKDVESVIPMRDCRSVL